MPDATPAHSSHYASRMVLAYRYGSQAFAAIAFVQAVAFAAMGSWVFPVSTYGPDLRL